MPHDVMGYGIWKLTKQQLERVREMTVSNSHPREIVSTLRQNDESTLVTNRDIYNACEQLRQQYLAGRTPI
ncbi:4385_t:CDS:2 [Acaulospora morrowiae]|uniref:4385_t:CDS:1 n=1 Tax=Acaulospora morrowiae TaxID=94023 RepID=A0A9N9HAS0_9GLOM|nr:4385_t:CDS:2 [Acaulospora morrowiae]